MRLAERACEVGRPARVTGTAARASRASCRGRPWRDLPWARRRVPRHRPHHRGWRKARGHCAARERYAGVATGDAPRPRRRADSASRRTAIRHGEPRGGGRPRDGDASGRLAATVPREEPGRDDADRPGCTVARNVAGSRRPGPSSAAYFAKNASGIGAPSTQDASASIRPTEKSSSGSPTATISRGFARRFRAFTASGFENTTSAVAVPPEPGRDEVRRAVGADGREPDDRARRRASAARARPSGRRSGRNPRRSGARQVSETLVNMPAVSTSGRPAPPGSDRRAHIDR